MLRRDYFGHLGRIRASLSRTWVVHFGYR